MKMQAKYFFIEAKWYNDGHTPTIKEYLRVARVTCYYLLPTFSILGMANDASIVAFEWIKSDPKSLIASGVISRIMNDITSHKVLMNLYRNIFVSRFLFSKVIILFNLILTISI